MMRKGLSGFLRLSGRWQLAALLLTVGLLLHSQASAFDLNVVDGNGNPVSGFRWLLEEDTTHEIVPAAPVPDPLAVSIHKSHAPTISSGRTLGSTALVTVPDAAKRYFVSVLPDAGYSIGGAVVAAGQSNVRVIVTPLPSSTAQISVYAFNDNSPISNAPDAGESGLAGFTVNISDAFGQVSQDVFGNPLGTTYVQDVNGNFITDAEGNPVVEVLGSGIIVTGPDGKVNIKYIAPGKYGIVITPPAGSNYIQTSTIEGTPTVDAWVKADEPPLLVEFGPALNHVFIGFVDPTQLPWAQSPPAPGPGETFGTIKGQLINNHISKPPAIRTFPGAPVPEGFVGLNDNTATTNKGLIAVACDANGRFTIPNVPPGTYQLVSWDVPLDYIFNFVTVTVPPTGGTINLGQIPMFAWFSTLEGRVFFDANGNGFPDPGEPGLSDQAINLRFRDGSIYQATVTTPPDGEYSLAEVFPFFKWLVAEVDFARFKATGATIAVDQGGRIPPGFNPSVPWAIPTFEKLNPQLQAIFNPNTGNFLSRTEPGDPLTAPVLLEGVMQFAGMTNVIDWGKTNYAPGENGGITGIIRYAATRAEDDPRYAAPDNWEPGIPRVQVNLYRDHDGNGVIDDVTGDGKTIRADVDNYPLGWADGGAKGPEDVDRNKNGVFDAGDALQIVWTDSWDDSTPTGCIQSLPVIHGVTAPECYDNFGTWNQVRPAVFDGGYGFFSYFPGGIASGSTEVAGLPADTYIVESAVPAGYQVVKEEDKNVDFGDSFIPSKQLLPPVCVGANHVVPAELSLFPGVPSIFAGKTRKLCDRKQITVSSGKNAAVDFYLFTEVPKAARAVGVITNDLAAELDPNSPGFGEKAAPRWIPISFRDWKGNEIVRTYSDEFGAYNALLPSSYTANIPTPTGFSPHMIDICLNHPGPIEDPSNPGTMIVDPQFDPRFGQVCYTFDFMPAKTTYLDTPVVPVSAFVGNPNQNVDVRPAGGMPVIASVTTAASGGPLVCSNNETITITSLGVVTIPNPDYPSVPGAPTTITRDFGFGDAAGTVTVGGTSLNIVSWTANQIRASVPLALAPGGQLLVTRGDNGKTTETAVTLHVGGCGAGVVTVSNGQSIQAAIDAVPAGGLVLVGPGVYNENPVIWKNVRLQGSGAGATMINAAPFPSVRLTAWKSFVQNLISTNPGVLAPGQTAANLLDVETAPGVLVLVPDGTFSAGSPGLIDGFAITDATTGGGILVNAFGRHLTISNNKLQANQGNAAGGICLGSLGVNAQNTNVTISRNQILQNGGINGGGGISIFGGSDNYNIIDNRISGNFTRFSGGGIMHNGLSGGGLIARNIIAFNEVFYGGAIGGDGGGLYLSGESSPSGAGSITVNRNLIQGNLAGSGLGGGIRAVQINGANLTYKLNIFNNLIVNNLAAHAGGGIALKDALDVNITHNTVAHNDCTATAAEAFPAGNLVRSTPQPAGIVAELHSAPLATASGQTFTNPVLYNNIVVQNRSFYTDRTLSGGLGGLRPASSHPAGAFPDYWDLQVMGGVDPALDLLNPDYSLLSSLVGPSGEDYNDGTNTAVAAGGAGFITGYFNQIFSAQAGDEGGNFVNVTINPLRLSAGNYHLYPGSVAQNAGGPVNTGAIPALAIDYDGQARPGGDADTGADEISFAGLTVLTPNGGEVLYSRQIHTVRWAAQGGANNYDLEYSTDDGASWIAVASVGNVTSYAWSVPVVGAPVNTARFRVTAKNNANVLAQDTSDAAFVIAPSNAVTVLAPNGGETLTSGEKYLITWSAATAAEKYRLRYSTDGGATWTGITTVGNVTSYLWTVPEVAVNQNNSRLQVIALSAAGTAVSSDQSDASFIIKRRTAVVVVSPNGGEYLTSGSTFTIRWLKPYNAASHLLQYSTNNGASWITIATVGNVTSYVWTVPNVALPQASSRVRVIARNAGGTTIASDRSDATFAIIPRVTMVAPNGGETLTSGSIFKVRWKTLPNAASHTLSYSKDNGASWINVKTVGAVTSFDWKVPAVADPVPTSLFRVIARDGAGVTIGSGKSAAPFTIQP